MKMCAMTGMASLRWGSLKVTPTPEMRVWEFSCPECAAPGHFSFKHRAGWCDACCTTYVQDAKSDGLRIASGSDTEAPRWIRVQVQPAEIF